MESHNGIARIDRIMSFHRTRIFAPLILLLGSLTACAGHQSGDKPPPAASNQEQQRITPIIVNLEVARQPGGDLPDPNAITAVRERFLERLKQQRPLIDISEIRSFGIIPAVALDAHPALIAEMLTWPEVQSVSLDRELRIQ